MKWYHFYRESDVSEELKQRLKNTETWKRGLYMLFFITVYWVSKFVIGTAMLFQFLAVLFFGKTNEQVLKHSQNLSTYIYQIVLYLTFNSEQRPFPFGENWPEGTPKPPEKTEQTEKTEQITQEN